MVGYSFEFRGAANSRTARKNNGECEGGRARACTTHSITALIRIPPVFAHWLFVVFNELFMGRMRIIFWAIWSIWFQFLVKWARIFFRFFFAFFRFRRRIFRSITTTPPKQWQTVNNNTNLEHSFPTQQTQLQSLNLWCPTYSRNVKQHHQWQRWQRQWQKSTRQSKRIHRKCLEIENEAKRKRKKNTSLKMETDSSVAIKCLVLCVVIAMNANWSEAAAAAASAAIFHPQFFVRSRSPRVWFECPNDFLLFLLF